MGPVSNHLCRSLYLTWAVGLVIVGALLGSGGPALGRQDLFAAMAVQRPANPGLAPDLGLPSVDGRTVRITDFRGKVVLLGFFTTT